MAAITQHVAIGVVGGRRAGNGGEAIGGRTVSGLELVRAAGLADIGERIIREGL